jgi:hypothetical protein
MQKWAWYFLVSPQTANLQILGLVLQRKSASLWGMLVRKTQISKFVMINLQLANPKVSLLSQSANREFSNLQGKGSVSYPDPHWFAYNISFTYVL